MAPHPLDAHTSLDSQSLLIASLVAILTAAGRQVHQFETHISWVIVADDEAFKFKKAVRFSFLDFSTLEARHSYCKKEVRLNARFSPDIYLGVVAITGSPEHPTIGGDGQVLEYAVKMRAFDQSCLWTSRIETGRLAEAEIDALASELACFHREAEQAPMESAWGTPATIATTAAEAFADLDHDPASVTQVMLLHGWEEKERLRLMPGLYQRKEVGKVCECHGDLHCGNILTGSQGVRIFDCIEFNPGLRWIDVMNDIAFVCMDLGLHGRSDFASRLLNAYLEQTGDYAGLTVFRYYAVMRAVIRAKVVELRWRQAQASSVDEQSCRHEHQSLLAYAETAATGMRPVLVIMTGLAGTGKSSLARTLAGLVQGVQIRSDVERKRMAGIPLNNHGNTGWQAELYDVATTEKTYAHLLQLAHGILRAGMPALVDASFLRAKYRQIFRDAAQSMGVPFFIVEANATVPTLVTRVALRLASHHDASDADVLVLKRQLEEREPLSAAELPNTITVDTEIFPDRASLAVSCASLVLAAHAAGGDAP